MSKSLGNVVNPCDALGHFVSALSSSTASTLSETEKSAMAADCLRYCLVRSVCLHEDTTFSLALATEIVNTELVNWLGNLLSRWVPKRIFYFHHVFTAIAIENTICAKIVRLQRLRSKPLLF